MGIPIRVLLVDDEERFVQNLAKLLRGRGFEVCQLKLIKLEPTFGKIMLLNGIEDTYLVYLKEI